jgi:prepilin-type N-terminal cleavage/methylation domain-containing protein
MMKTGRNTKKGFTLIEILIVIGIIAILATVVLIAINPARQFAQARNSQRVSNVNTLLNAIGQRIADNKGTFAGAVGSQTCPNITTSGTSPLTAGTAYAIYNGAVASPAPTTTPALDLSCISPTYVASFPSDPSIGVGTFTGYLLVTDTTGRVTISAAASELGQQAAVTR